jgi:hypothetical protein
MRTLLVIGVLAAGALAAQNNAKAKSSPVPRAANGKPDLTGVWQPNSTIAGNWEEPQCACRSIVHGPAEQVGRPLSTGGGEEGSGVLQQSCD